MRPKPRNEWPIVPSSAKKRLAQLQFSLQSPAPGLRPSCCLVSLALLLLTASLVVVRVSLRAVPCACYLLTSILFSFHSGNPPSVFINPHSPLPTPDELGLPRCRCTLPSSFWHRIPSSALGTLLPLAAIGLCEKKSPVLTHFSSIGPSCCTEVTAPV